MRKLLTRTFIGRHSTLSVRTVRVDVYYFGKNGLTCRSSEYNYFEYARKTGRRMGSYIEEDGKKFVDEIKSIFDNSSKVRDWYWIIPESYKHCKGMTEEEVISYIRENRPKWCFKEDTFNRNEDGYGILTGKGKVFFRRKEGNKKANTFDFITVEFPVVKYDRSRKEIFDTAKNNSKNLLRDAYKLIEGTKLWEKNEVTVNMLRPYNMVLTSDYTIHIDFELKTLGA